MSFVYNRISLRIVTPSSNVVKSHYLKVMNLLIIYSVLVRVRFVLLYYCIAYCIVVEYWSTTVVLVVVFHYCTIRFTALASLIELTAFIVKG